MSGEASPQAFPGSAANLLLELARRARRAQSEAELRFILVNDSYALSPYRQGAFHVSGLGIQALSGVVQIEANAPYVQWLEQLCAHLAAMNSSPALLTADDVPQALAEAWPDWLPPEVLWLPMAASNDVPAVPACALLLARDEHWAETDIAAIIEWLELWWYAWRHRFTLPFASMRALRLHLVGKAGLRWWQRRILWWTLGALTLLAMPVTLSVRAPGELVPAHPVVIRSPLDGVIDRFFVGPNEQVSSRQPLLALDDALLNSRLGVARQELAGLETDYRQTQQMALHDMKSKGMLAMQNARIEEKRAEVDYLEGQLDRVRVLAPAAGVVLLDDPSEWVGRPVTLGERVLRIAALNDAEVEVWLSMGDAIALPPGAPVTLYLDASPLEPLSARLRYVAHEAQQRPDGSFAFRVRATLIAPTVHRVGLKGTARLEGERVTLAYYLLRRPLAALRTALGV